MSKISHNNSRRNRFISAMKNGKPIKLDTSTAEKTFVMIAAEEEAGLSSLDDQVSKQSKSKQHRVKAKRSKKLNPKVKASKPVKESALDRLQSRVAIQPDDLPNCSNVEHIEGLRSQQQTTFRTKIFKRLDASTNSLPEGWRQSVVQVVDGKATDVPSPMSPMVLTDSYEHLHRALVARVEADPTVEMVFVTIVSGDSETSTDAPVVDVVSECDKARKVARSISPDYIGIIEVDMFNSHTHPNGGRIVFPHTHMICIGQGVIAAADAAAEKFNGKWPASFTDAPVIKVKPVSTDAVNLARIASYLFKPPHKAKTWCPPSDGKPGHMNHSEQGDRMVLYLRMAMIRSMLTLDDVLFAGGACKMIRRDLISLVRANCRSHVLTTDRMLAPDTIGTFWVEVTKALKRDRWQLPVILRRP